MIKTINFFKGFILAITLVLLTTSCGKKEKHVVYVSHSPVQNPGGIFFNDDPQFVKEYSSYKKREEKKEMEKSLSDFLGSVADVDNVDSLKGAKAVDVSDTGWNVDFVDESNSADIKNKFSANNDAKDQSVSQMSQENLAKDSLKHSSMNTSSTSLEKNKNAVVNKNVHVKHGLKKFVNDDHDGTKKKKSFFKSSKSDHQLSLKKSDSLHSDKFIPISIKDKSLDKQLHNGNDVINIEGKGEHISLKEENLKEEKHKNNSQSQSSNKLHANESVRKKGFFSGVRKSSHKEATKHTCMADFGLVPVSYYDRPVAEKSAVYLPKLKSTISGVDNK